VHRTVAQRQSLKALAVAAPIQRGRTVMIGTNRIAVRALIRDVMRRPTSDRPLGKFERDGDVFLLSGFPRGGRPYGDGSDDTPLEIECYTNEFHPNHQYSGRVDMVRALQIAYLHMRDWPFEETLHCIVSFQDGSDDEDGSRAISLERFGTIDSFHMRFYVDRGERLLGDGSLEAITVNGIIEFDTNDLKDLGFEIGPKKRTRRKPPSSKPAPR
jgi:hypothetical protein